MRLSLLWKALVLLVVLCAAGVASVYALSEWELRRARPAPFDATAVLPRSGDSTEARRQAILVGCWEGCHGKTGQGLVLELPHGQRLTAPALSAVLPLYSDGELIRLLRYGVRRDGSTALMMPADTFYPMSDAHIGMIVEFLRRQPRVAGSVPERTISLRTRIDILRGDFPLSARDVDVTAQRWGDLPMTTAFARGRYIASTICAECHGRTFDGDAWDGGPPLAIVVAYDLAQFTHLLRTGEALDRTRDLGDMAEVARDAFVLFTDEEIADLYAFLRERVISGDDIDERG